MNFPLSQFHDVSRLRLNGVGKPEECLRGPLAKVRKVVSFHSVDHHFRRSGDPAPVAASSERGNVVLHAEQHGGSDVSKYPASITGFTDRLAQALTRRLYPYTNLRIKQIPIGDREALVRWSRGQGTPSSENLAELIKFFWNAGDRGFLWEVLGIEPMPVCANEIAQEFAGQMSLVGA